jgi:hypothetical protein
MIRKVLSRHQRFGEGGGGLTEQLNRSGPWRTQSFHIREPGLTKVTFARAAEQGAERLQGSNQQRVRSQPAAAPAKPFDLGKRVIQWEALFFWI